MDIFKTLLVLLGKDEVLITLFDSFKTLVIHKRKLGSYYYAFNCISFGYVNVSKI